MDDTHIPKQEIVLKIPVAAENIREELNFYRLLREQFRIFGKPTEDLDFVIRNFQEQIREFDEGSAPLPDRKVIEEAIARHPYFKNPCDYPIRLLTILKYLKRKRMLSTS